MVENIFIKIWT